MVSIDVRVLREADGPGSLGCVLGWWAKGHHDPFVFIAAIQRCSRWDWRVVARRVLGVDRDVRLEQSKVAHGYYRAMGYGPGTEGCWFWMPCERGRGATAVTVLYLAGHVPYETRSREEVDK